MQEWVMALSSEFIDYGVILLVIAAASYIQAISGFAFALIIMGVVPSLELMPVADAAVIVTMLAVVNTATALSKGFAKVRWREARVSMVFSLPSIAVGLYLFDLLSTSYLGALRLGLGITILVSAVMLLKPPHQNAVTSGMPSFAAFGVMSGLLSGLFSAGGPPVVFQFYRQPWGLPVVRDSLFAIFFIGSVTRTILVAMDTGIEIRLLVLCAIAVPVVIVFTKIGQRYATKISDTTVRRGVFGLLTLTALTLIVG